MRRVLLPLLAGLLLVPVADAAAARTCKSGKTVYQRDGVRVFQVDTGGDGVAWFACSPRVQRPARLADASATYLTRFTVKRAGDVIAFVVGGTGEGGGESVSVGRFDPRTGDVRSGGLANQLPGGLHDIVAARGALGVVSGSAGGGTRVGYLAPGRRRGELRGELVLSTLGGSYVRGSLTFAADGRTLSWREDGRPPRTVPVTGEAAGCAAGTTLLESGGARIFELTPARKGRRGFQLDQLLACPAGATAPVVLGTHEIYAFGQWLLRAVRRSGTRVAFIAGDTGVGLLDGGQARFIEPAGISYLHDVAVGTAGPAVFAGIPPEGGGGGQRLVARLAPDFKGWERLATQGGEIVPGSLGVGDDGRVTWRTKAGLTQDTPLDGETVIDCAAGTTLLETPGLRVFEALPAGFDDARLLACRPDSPAPVLLLSAPHNSSWKVIELTREVGSAAIYASTVSGGIGDRIISFTSAPGSSRAGVPTASQAYAYIRDMAIAADGRVAVALREGRRWTVTLLGLDGSTGLRRERVLVRPKDGVRAGSLAFSPDGARVTWRSRSGAARSAPAG